MYPYVGSDLDGTTVLEDFSTLPETVKSIQNFQLVSNHKFFIVTGRSYEMMKKYIADFKVSLPVVSANGAAIIDPKTEEVLFANVMDRDLIIDLWDLAQSRAMDLCFYTSKTIIGLKNNERINKFQDVAVKHWEKEYWPNMDLYDFAEDLRTDLKSGKHEITKCLFSLPEGKQNDESVTFLLDFAKKHGLSCPTTLLQGRFMIDIMNPGINKAFGLKRWSEIIDVPVEDIYVFGDNNNDVEMLKQSNHGYAVGNAVDNLKKVAKHVVSTVHDNGVGKTLESLIK